MSDSDEEDSIFGKKRKAMQMKLKTASKGAFDLRDIEKEQKNEQKREAEEQKTEPNTEDVKIEGNASNGGVSEEKWKERIVNAQMLNISCDSVITVSDDDKSRDSVVEVHRTPSTVVTRSKSARGATCNNSGKARGKGRGRGRGRGGRGRGRGRGRKSDVDMDAILQQLDQDELRSNCHFDSFDGDVVEDFSIEEQDIEVKFMCKAVVKRIKMKKDDKLYITVDELAEAFQISDPMSIIICFRNKIVPLESTAKSLNLTVADILYCLVKQVSAEETQPAASNPNEIKLIFRDQNCGQEYSVTKDEELLNVMQQYCETNWLDIKKLIFDCAGDILNGSETAESLEMESGTLIDVKVKK